MVCTIQWELAEKMAAEGPGRHYAALSAWIQSQASVRILRRLGPNVFWPRPKVDSAIVSIWRNPAAAERIHDRRFFQDFLRRIFSQRRKHLRSVLSGMYRKQLDKPDVDQLLTELSLAADQRAELMQVADLINLSNALRTTIQQRGLDPDTDTDPEIDTDTDQEHDTEN
jgi:16S rRNA (adenine1518-N6/adenine1519-N6)-dimethyltransferase